MKNNDTIGIPTSITVKRWKNPSVIILGILLLCLAVLQINRLLFNQAFSYFNLIFPATVIIWGFILINIVFGTTTFMIFEGQLIVSTGLPLLKSVKKYQIDQIENLSPEYNIPTKAPLGIGYGDITLFSHKYNAVTFDYHGRRIMLGLNLQPFDLDDLVDMISADHKEILYLN